MDYKLWLVANGWAWRCYPHAVVLSSSLEGTFEIVSNDSLSNVKGSMIQNSWSAENLSRWKLPLGMPNWKVLSWYKMIECRVGEGILSSDSMVTQETAMECVRRAVWGMLYADDAYIVSRPPQRLERMMATLVDIFGVFGLTVSKKKQRKLWAYRSRILPQRQ